MSRYANDTEVSVERSEMELKKTLMRYGADEIFMGTSAAQGRAKVQFLYRGLRMQVLLKMPSMTEKRFHLTPTGKERHPDTVRDEWAKACRQQWRVLVLLVKAQLEAVENGLMNPEEAFLPWLLLPSGQTVIEHGRETLKRFVESGETPRGLLEMGKTESEVTG